MKKSNLLKKQVMRVIVCSLIMVAITACRAEHTDSSAESISEELSTESIVLETVDESTMELAETTEEESLFHEETSMEAEDLDLESSLGKEGDMVTEGIENENAELDREKESEVEMVENNTSSNNSQDTHTAQEYIDGIFNTLPTDEWEMWWSFVDMEAKELLDEREYNKLKTYVEAGMSSGNAGAEEGTYLDGAIILERINGVRSEAGLNSVSWNEGLADLARTRAYELTEKYSHKRPDGSYTDQYYHMGECAAKGQQSVEDVFDAWMASDDHKDAILYESHTSCYLAGYKDATGYYWILLLE